MFTIDKYKKYIQEFGYQNKKNRNQDKCDHFNHMPMQSLLGINYRPPLSHMTKSYIWLEEKKRINEFSIGYMINPSLNIKIAFKQQVTKCTKTKFGAITQPHISKILKKNTRVFALLMFYDTRKILRKFSKF